jgi:hypothetical protein
LITDHDVRFGSLADNTQRTSDVRFRCDSGRSRFQFMVRVLTEGHEVLTREPASVLMAPDGSGAPVAAQAEAHSSPCA